MLYRFFSLLTAFALIAAAVLSISLGAAAEGEGQDDAGADYSLASEILPNEWYFGNLSQNDLMDYYKLDLDWDEHIDIAFEYQFNTAGENHFYVNLYSPMDASNVSQPLISSHNDHY